MTKGKAPAATARALIEADRKAHPESYEGRGRGTARASGDMKRDPTREEEQAFADYLREHPEVLNDDAGAIAMAKAIAFQARVAARLDSNEHRVSRLVLREALTQGGDELTVARILVARREWQLHGPPDAWRRAGVSKSTYIRGRHRYGLVPWPREYLVRED